MTLLLCQCTPSPLFPSLKESAEMSHKSGMQMTLLEWVLSTIFENGETRFPPLVLTSGTLPMLQNLG